MRGSLRLVLDTLTCCRHGGTMALAPGVSHKRYVTGGNKSGTHRNLQPNVQRPRSNGTMRQVRLVQVPPTILGVLYP